MTTHHILDARLAAALRVVASHGIAVRRATGDPATGAHAAMIRAELAARYPAGMGSYVLWATTGDACALHCSDPSTAAAVAAACEAAGIAAARAGTVVTAGISERPAAAARDTSSWRWLEARAA